MQMMKHMSWVGMSLILILFSRVGWTLVPAEQCGASQQQSTDVQPKEPQPQNAQPSKPGPGDSSSRSESLPDSPVQSNASIGQTTPGKDAQQSTQTQQHDDTQKPSGAAAAESENISGVAASRPSGVAIAPAKQHRRRAFWVRVGAVAGASVAVGTALGLARSSPSKPPGSH
jgi:cytoskeletal protein RodZ